MSNEKMNELNHDIANLLGALGGQAPEEGALTLMISLKRIVKAVEVAEKPFLKQANIDWKAQTIFEDDGKVKLAGGVLQNFTSRTTYLYPQNIVNKATELKALQESAKIDGSAIKKNDKFNAEKDRSFSVTVGFKQPKDTQACLDLSTRYRAETTSAADPAASVA